MATSVLPTPPASPLPPLEPIITFGIEMEFVFAARRQIIESFLHRPMHQFQFETELFLCHFLGRRGIFALEGAPPAVERPMATNFFRSGNPHEHKYHTWTVTNDVSVGASLREVATAFNLEPEGIIRDWHWAGIELVSPVLRAAEERVWFPILQQIETDLRISPELGAIRNSACGLHMHFGFLNQEIPLLTLQNLFIIWAICEEEIDSLHPAERLAPRNSYAQSLRNRCGSRYNHLGFARGIYATDSVEDIGRLTGASPQLGFDQRYSKITIAPERQNKPMTVEFREHRGTTDAEEIYWWQRFCHGVLIFSHSLRFTIDTADIVQELKYNVRTRVAGIEEPGLQFFARKIAEYDLQKERIASGLESIDREDEFEESDEFEGSGDAKYLDWSSNPLISL